MVKAGAVYRIFQGERRNSTKRNNRMNFELAGVVVGWDNVTRKMLVTVQSELTDVI